MKSSDRKRKALLEVFPGRKWAYKIRHLTDAEVIDMFAQLKAQGKVGTN